MSTPSWFVRPLGLGDEGLDVMFVQSKIGAQMTGEFDDDTAARVRGVQRKSGLEESGAVDEVTAGVLGDKATAGQVPEWFDGELVQGDHGPAARAARQLLGLPLKPPALNHQMRDALLRFQSAHGLDLTGRVDEATAVALGDLP